MIKIMVADDEPLQRQYLRTVLEEFPRKFKIVAEADNGEDAVNLGIETRPDIVFLDIRMPGIDGIEVARQLRVILPDARIVIVSAYSDFHYAQQSVGLGLAEYLLKPVESGEILDLAQRLSDEIEAEKEKRQELDRTKATLNDSLPFIRIGFVMDLINGNLTDESEMRNRTAFFGLKNPLCLAMNIWLDNLTTQNNFRSELEKQILQRQVSDAIENSLVEWPEHFFVSVGNGQYTVLLAAEEAFDDGALKEMVTNLANHICEYVREHTSSTVTVGIGRVGHGPSGIARSYREASVAGEYRVLYGGDQPIHADDVEATSEYANVLRQGYEKNLVMAVCMGDWDRTVRSFLSLWTEYISEDTQLVRVRLKISEICTVVVRAAVESNIAFESMEDSRVELEQQLAEETNPDVMKEKVINWLNELVTKIRTSREFRNVNLIDKAVRYMEDNFQKEIGLEDVAKQVYLSTCYFSRLFKQVKGWSFTEYLTHVRMEEARKLLTTTSYSVAEIAMRVGFRDARYFSQVFKKHAGKTPGSYRRDEASRILSTRE
ncbi:MAG: response regulator [Bacillota bacterium]|jgi:two-component system response regulator YesN